MIQFNRNVANRKVTGVQVQGPNVYLRQTSPTPPGPPAEDLDATLGLEGDLTAEVIHAPTGFFLAKNFSGIFVVESGRCFVDTDGGAQATFDDAGLDIQAEGCDFTVDTNGIYYSYPGSFNLMGGVTPVYVKNGGTFLIGNATASGAEPAFDIGVDGDSITVDGGTLIIDAQDDAGNSLSFGPGVGTLLVKGVMKIGLPTDGNEVFVEPGYDGSGASDVDVTVESDASWIMSAVTPSQAMFIGHWFGPTVNLGGGTLDIAGVSLTHVDASINMKNGGVLAYFDYEDVGGHTVDFTDGTYTDASADGEASWAWDFGDGSGTSADRNPTYAYADAGSYLVTLTVTSGNGKVCVTKRPVVVS